MICDCLENKWNVVSRKDNANHIDDVEQEWRMSMEIDGEAGW